MLTLSKIPPKVMKMRSMWSAAYYSFALGSFFLLLVYFLPIWFQAVKGASAVKSGIMNLPMILTLVIVSILSGVGVTVVGYCKCPSSTSLRYMENRLIIDRCSPHDCRNYFRSHWLGTSLIIEAGFQPFNVDWVSSDLRHRCRTGYATAPYCCSNSS